ncbi:MAG: hypothetical protein AAGG80_05290, partial [Pseudomonadota bacterium]
MNEIDELIQQLADYKYGTEIIVKDASLKKQLQLIGLRFDQEKRDTDEEYQVTTTCHILNLDAGFKLSKNLSKLAAEIQIFILLVDLISNAYPIESNDFQA